MFLQFKKFCSPSKFEFKDPDVPNKVYKGQSYEQLYQQIRGYRSQNELPPIDYLEVVVENYICRLPGHEGSCQPRPPLKRGLLATLRGGIALIQNLMYSEFAAQVVADARALECKDCPLNTFPDKGPFVKWSDELAQMSVGSRKSEFHEELGNCEGCGCPMRPKVFYMGPIKLTAQQKEKMLEANPECWQVKVSQ